MPLVSSLLGPARGEEETAASARKGARAGLKEKDGIRLEKRNRVEEGLSRI